MKLPTLYKTTKTGAVQQYDVETTANVITVTQGQTSGKKQVYTTVIAEGKNLGKSNATTPTEQAESEAKSKHQKKLDAGYSTDPAGTLTVQLPMKVKNYNDQKANVKFPCIVMTKYNGFNGTFRTHAISSRGGKVFSNIPHLNAEITTLNKYLKTTTLGGELYIHGQHLEDISSAVKKPKELSKSLEFRVFSMPDSSLNFKKVAALLNLAPQGKFVKPCHSDTANSHEEIEALYLKTTALGYEGIVIYNEDATYEYNHRSSDVFKYKPVQDAEYQVVSFKLDKYNHAVYTCTTPKGDLFSVKRKGSAEERLADAAIATTNIGKWLTVEFEMLSKRLKPQKPIGLHFRLCDKDGKPLE